MTITMCYNAYYNTFILKHNVGWYLFKRAGRSTNANCLDAVNEISTYWKCSIGIKTRSLIIACLKVVTIIEGEY